MPTPKGNGNSAALRVVRRLGRRRMLPVDRLRHDAFLDEVEEAWATDHYPWHARIKAFAAHCYTRLFDGPPSLAQVAVAGVAIACGLIIQAVVAPPANPLDDDGVPSWLALAEAAGLVLMAAECARSPRTVQRVPFAGVAALPAGVITLVYSYLQTPFGADTWALKLAVATTGFGFLTLCIGFLTNRGRTTTTGFTCISLGAGVVALLSFFWAAAFALLDETNWTIANVFNAFGCSLLANGFARSRRWPLTASAATSAGPTQSPARTSNRAHA